MGFKLPNAQLCKILILQKGLFELQEIIFDVCITPIFCFKEGNGIGCDATVNCASIYCLPVMSS
jgi:hypothetical protein